MVLYTTQVPALPSRGVAFSISMGGGDKVELGLAPYLVIYIKFTLDSEMRLEIHAE